MQQPDRVARITELVNGIIQRARSADEATLKRAGEGEWTATQVLAHVSEMLPFWAAQAREVSERNTDGEPFGRSTLNSEDDPVRLGAVEQRGSLSADQLCDMLQGSFEQAVADIAAVKDWGRTARHANGLTRTVSEVVDQLLIAHLEDHTRQLEALLTPTSQT